MRRKKDKKYKQLLITHYNFKEIDFIEEDGNIYTVCKDNVMLRVRDVYEDKFLEEFDYENR